jgi:hypothetical protein
VKKSHGLRLIEYTDANGTRISLEVSAEVAEALAAKDQNDPGARLKERTFTDLGCTIKGERVPLDGDTLDEKTWRRRVDQRPMPSGNPWEGPRFHFSLLLGENRPNWCGSHSFDPRGKCGVCHGSFLPAYAYCLQCDRCGRDKEIPKPERKVVVQPKSDGRQGGTGAAEKAKPETRRERRARERLERERMAG